MRVIILLIVGFVFIAIALILTIYINYLKIREERDKIAQLKAKVEKFSALANLYEEQNKDLHEKLLQKENDAGFIAGQENHVRDVAAELNNLKEQKELEALRVSGLALTCYEFLQALARSKEQQLQIETVSHGLESRNRELSEDIDKLQLQKTTVGNELQRLLCITKIIEEDKDHVV